MVPIMLTTSLKTLKMLKTIIVIYEIIDSHLFEVFPRKSLSGAKLELHITKVALFCLERLFVKPSPFQGAKFIFISSPVLTWPSQTRAFKYEFIKSPGPPRQAQLCSPAPSHLCLCTCLRSCCFHHHV